jgi:tRNA dimethylallyltransferase
MSQNKKIFSIIGPTASGKTELALKLVRELPFEIIGVDSVQIYKFFDVGSAKPSQEILDSIKHHLVDEIDPRNIFTVWNFYEEALTRVNYIFEQDKVPLFVGGSMMYFKCLFDGINDIPASNIEIRNDLEHELENNGIESLYKRLKDIDPDYARNIKQKDTQRIIRALDVFESSQKKMSELQDLPKLNLFKDFSFVNIALLPQDKMHAEESIRKRVYQMFKDGLEDEVKNLIKRDIPRDHPAMNAINYKETLMFQDGLITYDEMIQKCIVATRQFVKRQKTWMKNFHFSGQFQNQELTDILNLVKTYFK